MDGTTYFVRRDEFNADGVNVGTHAPVDTGPPDFPDRILHFSSFGYGPGCSAGNPTCPTCYLDGFQQNCAQVSQLMWLGVAQQCPHNDCGPRWNPNRDGRGRAGWEALYLFDAGFSYQALGPSTRPSGMKPPTLQTVSREESARRRAILAVFGQSGF